MKMSKSSRHSKIVGDFGEALVLYWLSKYGAECARVDHTGIDLIAKMPNGKRPLGISVKSRTRSQGMEHDTVNISIDNFEKAQTACLAFGCIPYFAIVIDAGNIVRCFLLSMKHLFRVSPPIKKVLYWKMKDEDINRYKNDKNIVLIELHSSTKW